MAVLPNVPDRDKKIIMYCAFPTRLRRNDGPERKYTTLVKNRAKSWGYAPCIPFDCGDYDDFEGNPMVGREVTLEFMLGVMRACHTVGIFGISDGVMGELKNALEIGRDVHVFHGIDPEWEKYYEELKGKYGDLLKELRGNHTLFSLVGSRAIGKTYWSDRLLKRFGDRLRRVKNTTTRPIRDPSDHDSYNFVGRKAFLEGIAKFRFLEYTEYRGNFYGSSLNDIRSILKDHSGIFAITPDGAETLYAHRFEMNLMNILMIPASDQVLLKNFDRRGIHDPLERQELLAEAKKFTLPTRVDHQTVVITGDNENDERALARIIEPLLH